MRWLPDFGEACGGARTRAQACHFTHKPAPSHAHPSHHSQVLARGEKIELLVDKTDQLNQSAKVFQKSAKGLKNAMWWKNVKMWLMCVAYPAPPLPLSLSRARAWDTTQPLAR